MFMFATSRRKTPPPERVVREPRMKSSLSARSSVSIPTLILRTSEKPCRVSSGGIGSVYRHHRTGS